MERLEIRRAGPDDLATLAALVGAFRDHLADGEPSDKAIRRQLPRALADPSIEFACAWLDGRPVGYSQTRFLTSIWTGGVEAHLEDIFVVASARGRAVGGALLEHAIARAEARGAGRFSLNTNEGNAAGQALYRSHGLSPQSHSLYPGGREVLWVKALRGASGGAADEAAEVQGQRAARARTLLQVVGLLVLLALLLFASAGRVSWPMGWAFRRRWSAK
jgi:ribosomal protein S18 acetylase RimI-like enzyme